VLRFDREVAVAVVLMDGRPIVDAPVDEPPSAGQGDAAGPDPAKGKRHMLPPGASIDEALVAPGAERRLRQRVHNVPQFLMPLMAMPSITILCARRNRRITGSTDMLIAAMMMARLPDSR